MRLSNRLPGHRLFGNRLARLAMWCVVALALAPFRGRLERELRTTSPVRGSESAIADETLRNAFNSPARETAILVIGGIPSRADSEPGRAIVRRLIAPFKTMDGVGVVVSPATSLDTMLVGTSGTMALALVGLTSDNPATLEALREKTRQILASERATLPALTMQWTGQPAVLADLRTSGASAATRAEMFAIPVTLLVAWWAFGSITNALLAVAVAAIITVIGSGAMGLLSFLFAPSALARSIVSLVGLALTVDYMLLITRANETSNRGNRPSHESKRATSTALIAAIVVAAGFVGLAIAPTGELRTTAITGALVALLAAAGAITVGRASADRTSIDQTSPDQTSPDPTSTDHASPEGASVWLRWTTMVTQRPLLFAVVSAMPLLFLANHARSAVLTTPIDNWLPTSSESTQALQLMAREHRAQIAGTARLIVTLPSGTPVLSEAGWKALNDLSVAIRKLPHAGDVHTIETIGTRDRIVAERGFSPGVRDHYISRDGQTALVDVIPSAINGNADALTLVEELRGMNVANSIALPGTTHLVSGLPAYSIDYQRATRDILPWVVVAATVATLVALLLAFRAPVIAIKAVMLNMLVAAAALGATVFVFQDGIGISFFGREAVGSILPTVPLLGFAATFGISMDYELFLLNGVLGERRGQRTEAQSIALGTSRSAALITRAACVMIAVFAAFAMSDLLPLAMLGFALTTAVLLDATLVRLVLAPALLTVAGKWNWWPADMSARHKLRQGS